MMHIVCSIIKDFKEIVRTKRNILFGGLMVLTTAMVFGTSLSFPSLIELLVENAPDMVADGSQIHQVMERLFPQTTRENMGIWASDIIIFFTIAIALVCCNLLPEEIRTGKWILVKEAGYSQHHLLLSKMLVYGTICAFPAFAGYNLYYALSKMFLSDNFSWMVAFGNSVVLAISVFFITTISISLSVVYRNHIMAVITMIITVLAAPDILTLFSFGKIFPTYLLTFTYNAAETFLELIIPFVILIVVQVILYRMAINRFDKIELAR